MKYTITQWITLITGLASLLVLSACQSASQNETNTLPPAPQLERMSQEEYGIDLKSRRILQAQLGDQEFMTDVLRTHGVSPALIDQIEVKSQEVFDVRRMQAGRPYTLITNTETESVEYFIYEKNDAQYVVFDLRSGVEVYEGRKKVRTRARAVGGMVTGSLYESIQAAKLDMRLVKHMEQVFAYTIDFLQLDKGDFFKIVYEEETVDEIPIGIRRIIAAQIRQRGVDYHAIYFQVHEDSAGEYYDLNGESLHRTFLDVPIELSDKQQTPKNARFVRGRGTIYPAPAGTPVVSVSDGVVVNLGSESRRGHYLVIRHNGRYTSQYEFMNESTEGLTKGSQVTGGQVIGQVGQRAGVSLLRFRFFDNGEVANHRKLDIPAPHPLTPKNRPHFSSVLQKSLQRLESILPQKIDSSLMASE